MGVAREKAIPRELLNGIHLPDQVECIEPHGMWGWMSPAGWRIVALHHSADPDKAPNTEAGRAWVDAAKRAMPNERDWRREYDLDFSVGTGQPYFPTFTSEIHVKPLVFDPTLPLLRGWDFGRGHPAVIWAQLDATNTLRVLGSLLGTNMSVFAWAPLIVSQTNARYPGARIVTDYGDFAGAQETDKGATTSILLQQFGIPIVSRYSYVEEGLKILEQRLMVREGGQPGILLDPSNIDLIDGFSGGYELESQVLERTGSIKLKNKPKKDGYYDHLMDALRYICIHVFSMVPIAGPDYKVALAGVHLWDTNAETKAKQNPLGDLDEFVLA